MDHNKTILKIQICRTLPITEKISKKTQTFYIYYFHVIDPSDMVLVYLQNEFGSDIKISFNFLCHIHYIEKAVNHFVPFLTPTIPVLLSQTKSRWLSRAISKKWLGYRILRNSSLWRYWDLRDTETVQMDKKRLRTCYKCNIRR